MRKKKRIVVKVGTSLISTDGSGLDRESIDALAKQVALLMDDGFEIVIVSSGAVAAGRETMTLAKVRDKDWRWPQIGQESISHRQKLSAMGQARMVMAWDESFAKYGYGTAQAVLTNQEFETEAYAKELARHINKLLSIGVVPIVNENDLLTKAEFKNGFSDNDQLMVLVAKLLKASTIICLMTENGYRENSCLKRELTGKERCSHTGGKYSRGGMRSKIRHLALAMKAGIEVYLANGRLNDVLLRIVLRGENPGTHGRALKTA